VGKGSTYVVLREEKRKEGKSERGPLKKPPKKKSSTIETARGVKSNFPFSAREGKMTEKPTHGPKIKKGVVLGFFKLLFKSRASQKKIKPKKRQKKG